MAVSAWTVVCPYGRLPLLLLQFRTQLHRNVNAMLLLCNRADKTAIDLFIAGTRALALQTAIIDTVRLALQC